MLEDMEMNPLTLGYILPGEAFCDQTSRDLNRCYWNYRTYVPFKTYISFKTYGAAARRDRGMLDNEKPRIIPRRKRDCCHGLFHKD